MPNSMINITKIIYTPHERLPHPHLIHLGRRISIWRARDPPTLQPGDPWANYGQPIGPPRLNFEVTCVQWLNCRFTGTRATTLDGVSRTATECRESIFSKTRACALRPRPR